MRPLSKLLELFYPSVCPFCGSSLPASELERVGLCSSCLQQSEFYRHGGEGSSRSLSCVSPCNPLYCLGRYADSLKESMIRYKFHGNTWLAKPFVTLLHRMLLESGGYEEVESITFVPISSARFAKRGYDQSRLLAEGLSKRSGLPCRRYLSSQAGQSVQSKKNRDVRVFGSKRFCLCDSVPSGGVLLVDDILTTGATLQECGELILAAGATSVRACVLASGRSDLAP